MIDPTLTAAHAYPGRLRLTVLVTALAAAGPAHAQQTPNSANDSAPMQKVEVRASADAYDPRRDDTASKTRSTVYPGTLVARLTLDMKL